jgi:hypothetical protein
MLPSIWEDGNHRSAFVVPTGLSSKRVRPYFHASFQDQDRRGVIVDIRVSDCARASPSSRPRVSRPWPPRTDQVAFQTPMCVLLTCQRCTGFGTQNCGLQKYRRIDLRDAGSPDIPRTWRRECVLAATGGLGRRSPSSCRCSRRRTTRGAGRVTSASVGAARSRAASRRGRAPVRPTRSGPSYARGIRCTWSCVSFLRSATCAAARRTRRFARPR